MTVEVNTGALRRLARHKVVVSSAATGMILGVLFTGLGLIAGMIPLNQYGVIGMPLVSILFAGCAGAILVYLDQILTRMGIFKAATRRFISFCMIFLLLFLSVILLYQYNFIQSQKLLLWGSAVGFLFGTILTVTDYRMYTVRKRLEIIELQNRYVRELAEKERLLKESARYLAIMEERGRITCELHESISQGIHGIVYTIHTLGDILSREGIEDEVKVTLVHLEKTAEMTLNELRAMTLELKPSQLEEKGLAEALRLHCDLFSSCHEITVQQDISLPERFSPELELALYRIVQEALANVLKHSGATLVNLSLQAKEQVIRLIIQDNGRGFDTETAIWGRGFDAMAARIQCNQGTLNLDSKPGTGTRIEILLPVG